MNRGCSVFLLIGKVKNSSANILASLRKLVSTFPGQAQVRCKAPMLRMPPQSHILYMYGPNLLCLTNLQMLTRPLSGIGSCECANWPMTSKKFTRHECIKFISLEHKRFIGLG